MIRACAGLTDQRRPAVRRARCRRRIPREAIRRDVVRAGREQQKAVRRRHRRRQPRQLAIGLGAGLPDPCATFTKGGGSAMTMSNVSFAAPSRSSSSNTSALTNFASTTPLAAADSSASASAGAEESRPITSARRLSPQQARSRRCSNRHRAHVLPLRERRHEGAVVALVVVPAGLLAAPRDRRNSARRSPRPRCAPASPFAARTYSLETFQRARRRVVAQDHVARRERLVERGQQRLRSALPCRRS